MRSPNKYQRISQTALLKCQTYNRRLNDRAARRRRAREQAKNLRRAS